MCCMSRKSGNEESNPVDGMGKIRSASLLSRRSAGQGKRSCGALQVGLMLASESSMESSPILSAFTVLERRVAAGTCLTGSRDKTRTRGRRKAAAGQRRHVASSCGAWPSIANLLSSPPSSRAAQAVEVVARTSALEEKVEAWHG